MELPDPAPVKVGSPVSLFLTTDPFGGGNAVIAILDQLSGMVGLLPG